ncbi:MAG: T9SS type A sorting domain-containing protein [Sphingobacteriaceae bacterium]|nr:T9SS type A sorting domain-containing protein [Sphingobacteriaceae bacterium]
MENAKPQHLNIKVNMKAMENKNMIIRIPEPCHEDWNKMTPEENGKFCGSCQKSVLDFSNKTDDEIKDILMHYKDQKVCGRFKSTQINRPLNLRINLNEIPRNISVTRLFALALLLSFGSHLFACYDVQGKMIESFEMFAGDDKNKRVVGEVEALPKEKEKEKKKEKEKCTPTIKGDVDITMVAGGLRVVYEEPQLADSTKNINPIEEEKYIKGKIKQPEIIEKEVEIKEVEIVEPIKDSILLITEPIEETYIELLGEVMAVNTVTEEVIDSTNVNVGVEEADIIEVENSWNVFPNPAKGDFTVSYELKKQSYVRVDVLDLQGKLISSLVEPAQQHSGKYQMPINLDVPNGIYLISLQINGSLSSKRIVIEK